MSFSLNSKAYFEDGGVNIMAFDDKYPAGHQSGISVIMNGHRIATNGDIRFEQTPGQWQPIPKQGERVVKESDNTISTTLSYPDLNAHLNGFNPIIYPDFEFTYEVIAKGLEDGVEITVNMDKPVPEEFLGKLCFNLELYPGNLFGKPWLMDEASGIFPRQANGPTMAQPANYDYSQKLKPLPHALADKEKLVGYRKGYSPIVADDLVGAPMAVGHAFTLRPEDSLYRMTVLSETAELKLYDGRMNHNNGWFALSSEIPANATKGALKWTIKPYVDGTWLYTPVVQVSQVGYHPNQPKKAIIELDARDKKRFPVTLERLTPLGYVEAKQLNPIEWGSFLRYNYLTCDFSDVKEEGMYRVCYGDNVSSDFGIKKDIYDKGVWQPVIEYFLPIQMCHMKVNEKYRVWHGRCHCDDARMAPVNYNHFDGMRQGPDTLSHVKSGEHVPGLNVGGWHDAGDFDLRIESQTGEIYKLAAAVEEFNAFWDETTVDQTTKTTEIHQPDGKNDFLQQIEHGALSIVAGYKALGRLYCDIICQDLRQYVLLGDPVNMTRNIVDGPDERYVFTENNPAKELQSAAHLAAAARVLKGFNDELSEDCLKIAVALFESLEGQDGVGKSQDDSGVNYFVRTDNTRIQAACELFLTTGDEKYKAKILGYREYIQQNLFCVGWCVCRCLSKINDSDFTQAIKESLISYKQNLEKMCSETPYQLPYRPNTWGAGWGIQTMGARYYFLHKVFPDVFPADLMYEALNFILGCHPGSNTASFASGVGAVSHTVAYGINRADWSYIPGGVSSGTALIRPDFPELLEFPYLWQQSEYVMGGGSSDYLFLVLAVASTLKK